MQEGGGLQTGVLALALGRTFWFGEKVLTGTQGCWLLTWLYFHLQMFSINTVPGSTETGVS